LHKTRPRRLRVLWSYLNRSAGRLYADRASAFQQILAPVCRSRSPAPGRLNWGRALRELGIQWIAAHCLQAKGRVKRCFGTLQDRLVKALRLVGSARGERANESLEAVFPPKIERALLTAWGARQRFARPIGPQLDLAAFAIVRNTKGRQRPSRAVERPEVADPEGTLGQGCDAPRFGGRASGRGDGGADQGPGGATGVVRRHCRAAGPARRGPGETVRAAARTKPVDLRILASQGR